MTKLFHDDVLVNVKEDLNIQDDVQDMVLQRLIQKVVDHFHFEYDNQPSKKHSFIIEDCVIKRFNRRKAEGATSISVEGHSVSYEDKFEFSEWDDKLRREFSLDEKSHRERGGVFFL